MQSTTDVPVMEVVTQILYGYYTIIDELGIKWNTDIIMVKIYTQQCNHTHTATYMNTTIRILRTYTYKYVYIYRYTCTYAET